VETHSHVHASTTVMAQKSLCSHCCLHRGTGTVSGQGGQRFLEKIRRQAPKFFFQFVHPGFQFAHHGFNSMGGQKPSSDYLNYLNKRLKANRSYHYSPLAVRTPCISVCLYNHFQPRHFGVNNSSRMLKSLTSVSIVTNTN